MSADRPHTLDELQEQQLELMRRAIDIPQYVEAREAYLVARPFVPISTGEPAARSAISTNG